MSEASMENEKEAVPEIPKNEDDEPMNPALTEPDAMAIAQRATTSAPSVSLERKKDLLVQARKERRKWVQAVPLPYTQPRDQSNIWSLDDRLHAVQSSLACKRLSGATKILSELYGLETHTRSPEDVAERVEALVRPFNTDERLLSETPEILAEALSKDSSEIVTAYHEFWSTLLKPECAMLVQGMRNWITNLQENSTDMKKVANSMKSYLDTTYTTLQSHVAWKGRVDQNVRRSMESFIYGHSQGLLDKLEWNGLFTMSESDWTARLEKLQFVKPSHLEIACLDEPSLNLEELLKQPVHALLSIDQYFSPYEKLQRILAVYQKVNATLSEALNQNASADRKLPSADDVLPTIILTVLRAKPTKIFRTLQFVDVFATQENLRGEAGYAYTNLYGAVQFLHDLDMDSPKFSITPEEFRSGIEESLSKTKQKLSDMKGVQQTADILPIPPKISVQDVRDGRLKGEQIDLEWALEKKQQLPEEEHGGKMLQHKSPFSVSLPNGFNRTYSFLGTRPEDVRMSDLPQLLEEYKRLANVTEQLLGERAALLAAEKRKALADRKNNVEDTLIGQTGLSELRHRGLSA
eukprot:scaffold1398_cov116-Cylindrotheca_fusiformis.AAC.11